MKKTLAMLPLLLVLTAGIGNAGENGETLWLSGWVPPEEVNALYLANYDLAAKAETPRGTSDSDGVDLHGPGEGGFEGKELQDEDLDRVRGGTTNGAAPNFDFTRASDIILWDEARFRTDGTIKHSNAEKGVTRTMISWQGR